MTEAPALIRQPGVLQVVLAGSTHIAKMVPVGLRSPFGGAQEIWLRELSVDQVAAIQLAAEAILQAAVRWDAAS